MVTHLIYSREDTIMLDLDRQHELLDAVQRQEDQTTELAKRIAHTVMWYVEYERAINADLFSREFMALLDSYSASRQELSTATRRFMEFVRCSA